MYSPTKVNAFSYLYLLILGDFVGSSHLDDTELTGQEDINLLHTIINTLPLSAAHKEGILILCAFIMWIIMVYCSGEIPSKASLFVITGAAATAGHI